MYACTYEWMDACMYVFHVCIPCMYSVDVNRGCKSYKYMYMYVSLCICMNTQYVYLYMYVYLCIIYRYVCMNTHVCVLYINMYVCISMYTYVDLCISM